MRMRMWAGLLIAASFAWSALWVSGPAVAQDKKKADKTAKGKEEKKKAELTDGVKAVMMLHTAYNLVDYGRKNKAPEALITAARIIGTTDGKKLVVEDKEANKENKFSPDDLAKEAGELLKEAVHLAKDLGEKEKASVEGLAAATRTLVAERKRGPVGGERRFNNSYIPPNSSKSMVFDLVGGSTSVSVWSLQGADLDVFAVGALTGLDYGSDTSPSPNAFLTFGHLPFAKIRITVQNCSNFGGQCRVIVN